MQFSETDFAFISRLLEDEGIWYYFDHAEDKHTLVITDRQDFDDLDFGYAVLPFMPDSEENRAIREGIQRIQRSRKVRPNEIVLRDFDFQNPRKNLQTKVEESRLGLQNTPLEWYDYAAGYVDTERGENLARLRLEEMQSDGHLLFGESNAVGLMAGKDFSLILHPDANRNRRFKLTRCDYVFVQDGPDSSSDGRNVTCRFNALNDDVAFRRCARRPSRRCRASRAPPWSARPIPKCIPTSLRAFACTSTGIATKPPRKTARAGSAWCRPGRERLG